MQSGLASIDESVTEIGAEGHAVDYDTLPTAILPVMSELFKAPLSKDEETYALEARVFDRLIAWFGVMLLAGLVGRCVG